MILSEDLLYYQLRYVDMSYLRGSKKDQNIFCFSCFALQIVTSRFANQKCFWEKQIHLRGYDQSDPTSISLITRYLIPVKKENYEKFETCKNTIVQKIGPIAISGAKFFVTDNYSIINTLHLRRLHKLYWLSHNCKINI